MATSKSKLKANKRYDENTTEALRIRVPKGMKKVIQEIAQANGESVNGMINRLINEECIKKSNEPITVGENK